MMENRNYDELETLRGRVTDFLRKLNWKRIIVIVIAVSGALALWHVYRFMKLIGM